MDIIVAGIITQALPVQSGVSQRGTQWSRASYIIEHESGQYPKRMVFDVSGNRIQELALAPGQQVTLHLNISCREYPEGSGKFFNSIEAWKVDRPQMQQYGQQPMQGGYAPQQQYGQPMPQGYAPQGYAPQGYPQSAQSPFPPQQNAPAPFPQAAPAPQQAPFPPQADANGQPMQQGAMPFPPAQ